jgi:diazepam-binding inhibitor (GABA receptor modulating acyl-CoA-binding protein)
MSDLDKHFKDAGETLQTLKVRPSDEELTYLYKYYKQATIGDVNIECPGFWNLKGQVKWKAWESVKGETQETAKQKYIEFANELFKKCSTPHV